jgi:hypothetical protein
MAIRRGAPEDREQREGRPDVRDDEHEFEDRRQGHAVVVTGTDDVVGIVENDVVENVRRDRADEGENEEHPGDAREVPRRRC